MNWETLLERAYTPYSKSPKACIMQGASGTYYPGVRVENVSFPLSISAIQSALFSCLSTGDKPAVLIVQHKDFEFFDYWVNTFSLTVELKTDIAEIALHNPLIPETGSIREHLIGLLDHAVVPNSNFPVSALLQTEDGYVSGVNIEVQEWNMGLCAERVAIAKAISSGYSDFLSLSIHTKYGEFSSPCGACRQVITEQLPYHPMKFFHSDGSMSEHMTPDLLPYHFKSGFLKS